MLQQPLVHKLMALRKCITRKQVGKCTSDVEVAEVETQNFLEITT